MQHFELNGQIRQTGPKAVLKAFRKQGLVPCNLYGAGVENTIFTVCEKELRALTDNPNSYIVDLKIDGKTYTAILHELQWHPVEDVCLHVDFLAVDAKKPIAIDVPIVIEGHAAGVQKGGKFYQNVRKLRVSGLMDKLPDTLKVDITTLDLDKRIKAGDLKYDSLSMLSDKDAIVCGVKSTRNTTAEAAAE